MTSSRRSRRSNSIPPQAPILSSVTPTSPTVASPTNFKKGHSVEFLQNGHIVTGKLVRRSQQNSDIWIVALDGGRRKSEKVHEVALQPLKSIGSDGGSSLDDGNGVKSRKAAESSNSSLGENSNMDSSVGRRPSDDSNNSGSSHISDSRDNDGHPSRRNQKRKVTFQENGMDDSASAGNERGKIVESNVNATTSRESVAALAKGVGTRSSRKSGDMRMIPPELSEISRKKYRGRKFAMKKKKKSSNENVTVVKMLTGTLYLYRGERPRAAFVRSKY